MISIFYVDDEPELLTIGKLFLEQSQEFTIAISTSAKEVLDAQDLSAYDAIISDYQMPEMDGIAFLKEVRSRYGDIPFILFTGRGREEIVIQALNEGADFYLQKGGEPVSQFTELGHKIRQAVQRRRAEVHVRDHERREADILNFLPDATFAIDTKGVVIAWNRAMEQMTGVPASSIVGKGNYEYAIPFYRERRPILIDLVLYNDPAIIARYPYVKQEGKTLFSEITIPHLNGGKGISIWFTASPLYGDRNLVIGAIESIRDITVFKNTENELRAANDQMSAAMEELKATEESLHMHVRNLIQSESALRESEARYRAIFENTGTAMVIVEEDTTISFSNAEFWRLSGYSGGEIDGKMSWTEFVVKEDLDRMVAQHRLRRERHEVALTQYEFRFLTRSGDVRSIFLTIDMIPGTKKSVASLIDISGRRQAEELYQTVFENTGTAMIIIEEDTTISHVNQEAEKTWGYSREEIEGRVKWPAIIVKEDREKMLEYHRLRRIDPASVPTNYEFRFIHKNGGLRDGALAAAMIPGTKKSVISLRDITDRKRAEHALQESEERFAFAIDGAHLGLWDIDYTNRTIRHNRYWNEVLGYTGEETTTPLDSWKPTIHPDDLPRMENVTYDHLKGKVPVLDMEYRIRHRDGKWLWIHTLGKVVCRTADGKPLRMSGINQDITGRKRAEEALRQSEKKYRNIIENMQDVVYRTDRKGKLIMFSPHGVKLAGYDSEDEMIGLDVALDTYKDPKARERFLAALAEKGFVENYPLVLKTRTGNPRIVTTSSHFYYDDQGNVQGVEGIIHDITEQRQAEDALRQAHRQLNLMASITRHDILNKVSVILGNLKIAEKKYTDPTLGDFFRKTESATKAIQSLIADTRVYQDLGTHEPQWQDLDRIQPRSHVPATITLTTDVKGMEVLADPMLEKVFFNLLDNSIRHGERVTEIRVSSSQSDEGLMIVWVDDGVGVTEEDKKRLFTRGFGKNTGLGLFLVREILSITGITITENGTPGKGARFEIAVPKSGYRFKSTDNK